MPIIRRRRRGSRGEKGQTTVEYILLIAMIVTVVISLGGRLKDHILSTDCNANPSSILCLVKGVVDPEQAGGYKYFTIMRRASE